MDVRYERPPSLLASSARALVRRGSGDRSLPEVAAELPGLAVDPAHLARYAATCGFAVTDPLPPTYPHVLAFPLALALMTRHDFPYRPLGLVHVANRITTRRPLAAGERLDLRVWLEGPHQHPRGTAFTVATSASAGGEPAWEEASTYLRREKHPAGTAAAGPELGPPAEVAAEEAWRLPADTGRRYAAASGDRNPIHLYPWTSRPFGFRRPIAHGMWTAARALAALATLDRLPAAGTVEVAFRAPIPLPGTVRFATGGGAFAVTSPDGDRAHLYGLVVPG